MRLTIVCVVALVVGVGAKMGTAQVTQLPTPPPQVSAAAADWQVGGEPIFYSGDFYYPAGPSVFFDGNVMKRTGRYLGVPLYQDATLEPYSMVYVPLGRNLMRPYERRRAGELAGTIGSRTPSFPIERDVEVSVAAISSRVAEAERRVVSDLLRPADTVEILPEPQRSPARTSLGSIPPPQSNAGVWVDFNGSRWSSDGRAVPFDPDRFASLGLHHGFPVYRDRRGPDQQIFIQTVAGGAVAPFRRQ